MESTNQNQQAHPRIEEDSQMSDVHDPKLIQEHLDRKELIAKKLKQEGKDSAHNSDEDKDHIRDAKEQREEKENEQLINYNFLGGEECPVDPEMDEIEYSMIFRIPRIENLEKCTKLRVSGIV